jgi:glutamate racemase
LGPDKRVLGVIRPTAEIIGKLSRKGQIGILATQGTVGSGSYLLEIAHFFPEAQVEQEACPLWVPLVENGEHLGDGADYFVHHHLESLLLRAPQTDTLLLGCTHYPLLLPKIREFLPPGIQVVSQGPIVAASLENYLQRHPEMAASLSTQGQLRFCTTDDTVDFNARGALFFGKTLVSEQVQLGHL